MHYKDGTEARLGDMVKGTGYNVPGMIVGTVVNLTPATDACNMQVAHVVVDELPAEFNQPPYDHFAPRGAFVYGHPTSSELRKNPAVAKVGIEYGQCDAFELVRRQSV